MNPRSFMEMNPKFFISDVFCSFCSEVYYGCFISQGRNPRLIKQLIDRGKGSITFVLSNKGGSPLRFHFHVSIEINID